MRIRRALVIIPAILTFSVAGSMIASSAMPLVANASNATAVAANPGMHVWG
jgi:hypothetical protein